MKIILLIALGGYAIVCAVAFFMQARLVFFPDREDAGTPGDVGLDYRDVFFESGRNRLHGWFVPAAAARFTLLYCHGNAGNISHRIELIRPLVERGLSVFIFDYSGYGKSEGRPGEGRTYADARAAWAYLTETEGVSPGDIIIFGRSLGSAIAIELATAVSPAGVVLESSFTSLPDLGARSYPFLPVRLLSRIRYNSWARIRDVDAPKLFVHSLDDELIPYGMGKRLYTRAARPKAWVRASGAHDGVYLVPGSRYDGVFEEFLTSLEGARGARGRIRPV